MPTGLSASRWASSSIAWPRPPPSKPAILPADNIAASNGVANRNGNSSSSSYGYVYGQSQPSPQQELSRFLKIVARLNWKMPFLNHGYVIAVDRQDKTQQEIEAHEIHFKIDFYEYYMLIERALVHLMGVYGISISRQSPNNEMPKPGVPRERISQHRYHANVLEALADPTNPLYEIFGQGEARKQLFRAKDLRNRWKNADGELPGVRLAPPPLESYKLEQILKVIFAAFDQAHDLASRHVRQSSGADVDMRDGEPVSSADWTTDSNDWEWMVDAMDWEVV
ncbi:hypothetical protein F5Y15DRAFT_93251 [Xylariaceae sp. FL0016]|nr:hypothetical protein F5Y15DRAFT_93251 [Xylariaceae sp. FL0016]